MKKILPYAAMASLFTIVAQAQNADVTWQNPATVTAASDVSTLGTYVGSWAPYDGGANGSPVNGVAFQGNSDISGFATTGFDNGYGGFPNPGTGNNNYNTLLQYGAYDDTGNGNDDTLTWSDIPGHTYLIQIWVNGNAAGRSETITGGANTSSTINYGSSAQYIIGTYVADGSRSETITLSGAGSGNGNLPQVNLLLIRDISIPPANVTWQAPAAISGASDVNTQGTYFGSWAPYASSSLAVNGVTFQNSSDLPYFNNNGFNAGYGSFPNPGTANNNYNTLLESAAYEYPGPACNFSWGGMTTGHTYLLQVWVNGNDPGRTETFTGGANTSASINYDPGQYITGTFVADNTGSETVTLNGAPGDNYPQINLVQVRDITPAIHTNYEGVVLADKPAGYWPLDLTVDTGGTATDASGNGNSGTYDNMSPSGNLVAGPSEYITNAASFVTADSDEVDLSTGGNTALLDFSGPTTLEAWVQPADSTTFGDIIGKGYDYNNYQEIALRVNGPYGSDYFGYFGSGGITAGQQNTNWVYLVLANDGEYDYMYLNGTLVQKTPDARGSLVFIDFVPWAIGNGTYNGNSRYFNGNICQVALYNYGLTAAQVLNHYYAAEINAPASTSVPIIVTQPQPQASYIHGSATFSVTAVSALAATNQWYQGSTPLAGQTNSTLTLTNLSSGSAGNYHVVIGNANGTTNSLVVSLTVAAISYHLKWAANNNNGDWDVDTSANWLNVSNNNQMVFDQNDQVLFDDTAGVPTSVSVNGTVEPNLITVNASVNNFIFGGVGTIGGPGSLVKEGTSTLTITNYGNFTGSATIAGGVVSAQNNSLDSVSSISITNSTLDVGGSSFPNDTPVTVSGSGFGGEGALFNSVGYGGETLNITLAGDTSFGGTARWDLNSGSQISGPHNLTVDWSNGGGYGQWNGMTIGANVPQVTVTNASTLGMTSMDTGCQNPATFFNISPNGQLVLYSGGFNGSVTLNNGAQMVVYSANVNLAGSTIHVYGGSTMYLYAQGIAMTGNNLILENGASLQTYYNSGVNPISDQVTLNGVAHFVLGNHQESFSNVVSGAGGFVLDYYDNDVVFSSSNTYRGPTIIGSSGNNPEVALTGNGSISQSSVIFFGGNNSTVPHIDVSGRPDQTLTLANGQTLGGIGAINGSLVVSPGATLSPSGTNTTIGITTGANSTGTLTATNNITLNGNVVMKVNGSGVSDEVAGGAQITYGGTLTVVNISGSPYADGDSFQLFSAPAMTGSFNISPAIPGPGLLWDTSQLTVSGSLNVITGSSPIINNVQFSSGNLVFSGIGGAPNANYTVYANTNLASTNWIPVMTNTFDGSGDFGVTNTVNPATPALFYRIY